MTRTALAILTLLLACLTVAPATADASVRDKIIRDCPDGKLAGSYTPAQLRDARQNLPTDVLEYTDCVDVLSRAEAALRAAKAQATAAPAGGTATAAPQSGTPAGEPNPNDSPTQFDAPALAAASKAGDQPVSIGKVKLVPASGVRVERSAVPSSVIVSLAVLAAAGACLLAPGVRRRLRPLLRRRG